MFVCFYVCYVWFSQNKNSAINVLLPFMFDFCFKITVYLTKLPFFNIKFSLFQLHHRLVKDLQMIQAAKKSHICNMIKRYLKKNKL